MPRDSSQSISDPMQAAGHHVLELLDQQYRDYTTLYRVNAQQRTHIAEEDVSGLQSTVHEIRNVMERIRLRQKEIPSPFSRSDTADPEVTRRNQAIGELIRNLQVIGKENEGSVRRLIARSRVELRQFQQGRQAVKGYRSPQVVEARFYDDKR